jgi:hypothetical protein
MNRPFNPTEKLVIRPEAKAALHIRYRIHEKIAAPVAEEEGEIVEPVATLLQEVGEDNPVKQIIRDKRKQSNIDRAAIFQRLRQNNQGAVIGKKDLPVVKPVIEPVGEARVKKLEAPIVITTGETAPIVASVISAAEPEIAVVAKKDEDEIEEDLKQIEKLLGEANELSDEGPTEIKIEDVPKKIRRPRKLKVVPAVDAELINIDLTTAKIRDQLITERLPVSTDKVIVKASAYYMNNREISVSKLNQLFQPYRKDIIGDDDAISCDSRSAGAELDLLTHQKIVRDYLNLYTPYRGLLLWHGLGSGKTASSIAIAEGMKSDKKVFVLTPASLKMNFFTELKRFGDQLYRKNQFWEFISIEGRPEYVSILSKALSLPVEYVRSGGGAWLVNIEKAANFTDKTAEEQRQIDDQLNMMIRAKYTDINYNGLTQKLFNNMTANGSKNPFDNSVVLIDEAHNFVSRIVNKIKKPASLSHKLYNYLMDATNARVVFMSGTPIINYPNEIGILFNMLRGYIKTWTMTVNVKTTTQVNTASILAAFDKDNFKSHDYVEYSGNKLTITRNPFGFINTKKRGAPAKGTKKTGGSLLDMFKGKRTTKKRHQKVVGGTGEFDKYNGVKLDDTGNLSDQDFQDAVVRILTKNGLEVTKGSIEVHKHKALPDDSQAFLDIFVNSESAEVKNMDLFQRRVLGLTSYFRSAQEKLLPRIEKTVENDIFHVVKAEMSGHQFSEYQRIRKSEAEQEKRNRKNQKKAAAAPDKEDLFKISSTYRIFSRSACNFIFPPGMNRPMPTHKEDEIGESEFNATPFELRQDENAYLDEEDIEEEKKTEQTAAAQYQKEIKLALETLRYNPASPREKEYLTKSELGLCSPKFVKVLENIQAEENRGLHLIYSQFRTIEGIGLLKLILEANGYAEFKIKKTVSGWDIDVQEADASKPKFVLYTGTETAEEKEIVRNIYNSTWDFVPPNIAVRLREKNENNFMGEVVKIFMITSSGAEGINLKNTRFVHIVEPYWHMVRIEQVIGRARRICSHQDLPEELRTVKVFLYLTVLSQEQKTSEDNIELTNRDVSRLDNQTPVTTDEMLLEVASMKDRVNRQILKAVKQSAMDCSLYSSKNKDEPLVCYDYGVVHSNQFGSVPSFESDRGKKEAKLNKQEVEWEAEEITWRGMKYALNSNTGEVFDLDSYLQSRESGAQPILVGHTKKGPGGGMIIELI